MRVALDTNVLAYAEGVNGARMKKLALDLVRKLPASGTLLPVQALGELFYVLVRKAGRTAPQARRAILSWRDAFPLVDTSEAVLLAAMELSTDHRLPIWDAVILSAAAEGGCRLLLSEDFQEGFTWKGVSVTNPFAPSKHALLVALLNQGS